MTEANSVIEKYKPSLFERIKLWLTNEECGYFSDPPLVEQRTPDMQLENEKYYYRIKAVFDSRPELDVYNNMYMFEVGDGKGNTPIARYPVYAVLAYNIAYVVGFTGLNYYSYVLRFNISDPHIIEDCIWSCLIKSSHEFNEFRLKKYDGLYDWPVLRDILNKSIGAKLDMFRLKPTHIKNLSEYTSKLTCIKNIVKHKWNRLDFDYKMFLEKQWEEAVGKIPKRYVQYIKKDVLVFPRIPFETNEDREKRKDFMNSQQNP